MDDTFIQQDLADTAVSDMRAGDASWIIWPPETAEFSVMGYELGGTDVMGPGGFPFPPVASSVMGYERGGTDVMGPGGFPRRPVASSVIGMSAARPT